MLTPVEAAAADDEPLLAHVVEIRARNLMWGLVRDDDGLEANRAGLERIGDAAGGRAAGSTRRCCDPHRPAGRRVGGARRDRRRRAPAGTIATGYRRGAGAGRHGAGRDGWRRRPRSAMAGRWSPGAGRHAG